MGSLRITSTLALSLSIAVMGGCGDDPGNWPAGRPRIVKLRFLQQSPQDPLALQFSLEFEDRDGDLGGGRVRMLIAGKQRAVRPLAEVFESQVPPVAPTATEGEFELTVRLQSSVEVGETLEIGFILEDARGEESNEPYVVLEALMAGGGP